MCHIPLNYFLCMYSDVGFSLVQLQLASGELTGRADIGGEVSHCTSEPAPCIAPRRESAAVFHRPPCNTAAEPRSASKKSLCPETLLISLCNSVNGALLCVEADTIELMPPYLPRAQLATPLRDGGAATARAVT